MASAAAAAGSRAHEAGRRVARSHLVLHRVETKHHQARVWRAHGSDGAAPTTGWRGAEVLWNEPAGMRPFGSAQGGFTFWRRQPPTLTTGFYTSLGVTPPTFVAGSCFLANERHCWLFRSNARPSAPSPSRASSLDALLHLVGVVAASPDANLWLHVPGRDQLQPVGHPRPISINVHDEYIAAQPTTPRPASHAPTG